MGFNSEFKGLMHFPKRSYLKYKAPFRLEREKPKYGQLLKECWSIQTAVVLWCGNQNKKTGRIYKLKLFLSTPWKHRGEQRYGSSHSQLLHKMEVRVLHVTLWPLYPPGKELWYPMTWRHGGAQGWSGEKKMSSDRGSNPDASNP